MNNSSAMRLLHALTSFCLFLFLPACAAPHPLARRQITNTLSLTLENKDAVYRSSDRYRCRPVPVNISGFFPPFSLSAIRVPYDAGDNASQVVLQQVGDFGTIGSARWNVTEARNLTVGQHFALRLTDAQGRWAFSPELELKNGSSKASYCKNLHPSRWDSRPFPGQVIFVIGMLALGAIVASILRSCSRSQREERRQRYEARQAAAPAAEPAGAGEVEVEAPIPLDVIPAAPTAAAQPPKVQAIIPLRQVETRPPGYEESMGKLARDG
ncbi:hypothetical protein JCM11251_004625 [Rhodosporidiobolus azoricus]